MIKPSDEFLRKLIATFQLEAADRVKNVTDGLLRLEKTGDPEEQADIVEALFRETHSLKGAARSVSNPEIERVCGALEGIFSSLKQKNTRQTPELLDLLHRAVDDLEHLLSTVGSPPSSKSPTNVNSIADALEEFIVGGASGGQKATDGDPAISHRPARAEPAIQLKPRTPSNSPIVRDTIRIAVAKLDSLLLQAGEMTSLKLAAVQRTENLRSILREFVQWKKTLMSLYGHIRDYQRSLRQTKGHGHLVQQDPTFAHLLESVEQSGSFLRLFEHRLSELAKASLHDQRTLAMMVESLQDGAKQAMMFPSSSLLEAFPKLVRDLARDQKKQVELVLQGAEIEMDKRILETIKDPLMHLLRNCIDHGIEAPEERHRAKKSRQGTITISVSRKNGNKIEVSVSDDGAGIDRTKLRTAALKQGILVESAVSQSSDDEIYSLMFQSGVSTSPMVTDVSGRGLGLAIVRERVENLSGHIVVESAPGRGTTFRLSLPLTIATIRGVLVNCGEHVLAVPTTDVERVARFRKEDIKTVENRETVTLGGEVIALARLGDVIGIPRRTSSGDSSGTQSAFVLNALNRRIALTVDAILHEQELLVKSLDPPLSRVRNIAGATILGSGIVVPILNVSDLITSAIGAGQALPYPQTEDDSTSKTAILVVEDSITARTLLRSILETAGHSVTTAVDGIDALTQLRTGDFHVVVSDVDMPRMNGFELTAKIRSDKKLADLPVVLVTALESREDRERGVEVGANAYIVKSSFDQSNLLSVIKRLT